MQRQSLGGGSPISKEEKQKLLTPSPSLGSPSPSLTRPDTEDEKPKSTKPSSSKPESIIHVIPILTFICFLILYLFSHSPSQSDLAQFDGFRRLTKPTDDLGRFIEMEKVKGDVLAIRSMRNLQEIKKHGRAHRKFGDF